MKRQAVGRALALLALGFVSSRSELGRADEEPETRSTEAPRENEVDVHETATPLSADGSDGDAKARPKKSDPKQGSAKAGSAKDEGASKKRTAEAPKSGTTRATKKDKDQDPKPLPGRTIDFEYDAKDVKIPSRRYTGRVFVHERIVDKDRPLPLVVFIHGLNKAKIKFRWIGGGDEGDVRRILSDLIDEGKIPPVLLAAPTSTEPDAVAEGASFPVFDFDNFLTLTEKSLAGVGTIDRSRVIVAGHSGAGCSTSGGIVAATKSSVVPFSILSIDTCMGVDLAKSLAAADPATNVIVTWETVSWDRNFKAFKKAFEDTKESHPAAEGVLRELDALPALPRAHDATVAQTFTKYLPRLLQ